MPIGAIGAMCLRRAIQGRWIDGVFTGFGAALADLLAAGAFFGLALVTHYLLENQTMLQLVGGIVLIFLGVRMIRKRRLTIDPDAPALTWNSQRWRVLVRDFGTGFAMTIINSATFLAFAGVFAGLGLFAARDGTLLKGVLIVAGAFSGSMLWWLTLIAAASAMRRHASMRLLTAINALLGAVVLGFGVFGVLTFLHTVV